MFRFLLLACSTVLLAALVAGCGGSERLEYERDLAEVGRVVDDSLEQLPNDDAETIGPEEVRRIADDLREAADQLEDLDPPSDAERAQRRLERGLRGVATAFDELAATLGDATTDAAKAELFVQFATDEQVDAAFDDLIGAQEAFAAEGYRVFGSGAPAGDDAAD
jgi:hypothetical protein